MILQAERLSIIRKIQNKINWTSAELRAWRLSKEISEGVMIKEYLRQNIIIGTRQGVGLFEERFLSNLDKLANELVGKSHTQIKAILKQRIKIISTFLLNCEALKFLVKEDKG